MNKTLNVISSWWPLFIVVSNVISFLLGGFSQEWFEYWLTRRQGGIDDSDLKIVIMVMLIITILIVWFLRQVKVKTDNTLESIKSEYKQTLFDSFRCSFLRNQDQRMEKMIQCINEAEKQIYILSDLSRDDQSERTTHKAFLSSLNTFAAKRENDGNIDITRIIVPPPELDADYKTTAEYYRKIMMRKAYAQHFKLLSKTKSLLGLPNGPRGISILLIDRRHLFVVLENEFGTTPELKRLLANGFYFQDSSGTLTASFENCFKEMFKISKQVDEF